MKIGEHEYKGIKVWYNEGFEHWECELDRERRRTVQREKLADLRKRIDDFVKREKKFERFEAIRLGAGFGRSDRGEILIVTSVTVDGEYWTINGKGDRSKKTASQIATNTPENMAIIQKALNDSERHRNEMALIEKQVDSLAIEPRK